MKSKKLLTFISIALMTAACHNTAKLSPGIKLSDMDTTAVPGVDFYQYACGGWMKNNPLPDEYSRYGSFDVVAENNKVRLNELISGLATDEHKDGTVEQKIGTLYNMVMDSDRLNKEGYEPLKPVLAQINAITDKSQLPSFLADGFMTGAISGLFYPYVAADNENSNANLFQTYQGGLGLGQRDYYVNKDPETKSILADYQKHIARMLQLIGIDSVTAKANAAIVVRIETEIAQAAYSNVQLRDPHANYNKISVDSLQSMTPAFNWKEYIKGLGISTDTVSVGQIPQMKEVGKILQDEPLENLKAYFTWQVVDGAASHLNDEFYTANFDFYSKRLSGVKAQKPRWKRAVTTVNGVLGEAVGQMYVKKYFPPEAKERMLELVKNLQVALGQRIDAQTWMGDSTKALAHEKLNSFYVKVGYPDKWRDYSGLKIDSSISYYENLARASRFENEYEFSFMGKPVDKTRWGMTPQTVNAYYNPQTNEICFPAGILQYPFFDMEADDAFNYGAIGVVIGHEMTHGFDDQGSQFDKNGNLKNWWTKEDREKFDAQTKALALFFDSIEVAPGVHANGEFTLGENIADHGGLNISFQAFENATKDTKLGNKLGFTPEQRFFLAYAGVWANNIRSKEILQRVKTDPHSLGRWRVDGALPQINAWYDAFNITSDSPMWVAPEKRVNIW
ncbi:MAG: M13 family metallopeptidase [Paludibacter sp.]|nr:M13 family metallopeptidase [Paludibacter sp.]